MKVLLLAAVLSVALSASSGQTPQELHEWELYKLEHMKEYNIEEEEIKRRNIFINNLNHVRQHNVLHERGEKSHREGINQFSDMTQEEISTTNLSCRKKPRGLRQRNTTYEYTYHNVPKHFDWRKKGAVTRVKNQGDCRACWAFGATGSLEGMNFIKTGKLVSLSEQTLLDCDNLDGGCNGGLEENAFTFISRNGGIETEESYPYKGKKEKCKFNPANVGATVTGHVDIPKGDEYQIMQAVATKGPVNVGVDATSIRKYKSGVFKSCEKGGKLSHAMLVVGYGTTVTGEDYWLIKNSWGKHWGMKGYMMLERGKNMCGVADDAVYPLV